MSVANQGDGRKQEPAVPPAPPSPMSPVALTITRAEAIVLYDVILQAGALTRPARGPTAMNLTPDPVLNRVDHIDMIRRKLAAALGLGAA